MECNWNGVLLLFLNSFIFHHTPCLVNRERFWKNPHNLSWTWDLTRQRPAHWPLSRCSSQTWRRPIQIYYLNVAVGMNILHGDFIRLSLRKIQTEQIGFESPIVKLRNGNCCCQLHVKAALSAYYFAYMNYYGRPAQIKPVTEHFELSNHNPLTCCCWYMALGEYFTRPIWFISRLQYIWFKNLSCTGDYCHHYVRGQVTCWKPGLNIIGTVGLWYKPGRSCAIHPQKHIANE